MKTNKLYIKPTSKSYTIEVEDRLMHASPGGPGNSGNAPGHNKDEHGHPQHPHHSGEYRTNIWD